MRGTMLLAGVLSLGPAWTYAAFPKVALQPITKNQLVAPVGITNAGDGTHRLFVNDQRGAINILSGGSLLPTPFLDLSAKLIPERAGFDERGLLGLAFHPNFGQVGLTGADKFYVFYTAPRPGGNPADPVNPVDSQSVIAEYRVTAPGSNVADPNSERILLTIDKPQFNHNGGFLGFGPDNMLYITTGDGGGGGDNEPGHTGGGPGTVAPAISGGLGNAQDRSNLLGKMLRIDVGGTNGPGGQYGIPADNPFVGVAGVREEIYAYGLRNPWRATFDGDRLIAADVGQGAVEEVNLIVKGGNYGWRIKEGAFDFDPTVAPNPAVPLIDPIAQYTRASVNNGLPKIGISVTGGVVYRGTEFPELFGKYLFGDFSTGFNPGNGTLLGLEETSPGAFGLSVLDVTGGNPISEYIMAFGLDENGEAYVATRRALAASGRDPNGIPTGAIYRIIAVPELGSSVLLVSVLSALLVVRRRSRSW